MLKNLFKKKASKELTEVLFAPLSGEVVKIENVPDPVFSAKMMGDGIAIIPTEGKVVAPIDGEIVQVFHTKHAIGLRSINGLEILIHIGLETVNLKGEGYEIHIEEGQKVTKGDLLVTFDIEFLKSKDKPIITPIVITNSADKLAILETVFSNKDIKQNEPLARLVLK